MSRTLRATTLWLTTALWLSGAAWMGLHYFLERPGEFGLQPHPLEQLLIFCHGILGLATVFLLGWLGSSHITSTWRRTGLRPSGVLMSCGSVLLIISGYALYYLSNDRWRYASATLHELLGLAIIAVALVHYRPVTSSY
jgi:hypothetical protein